MLSLALLQAAAAAAPTTLFDRLATLAGEGAAFGIVLVVKHHVFDKGAAKRQTASIEDKVESCASEVRTLSAHVIGPDGENGLRGDLREVKKRVIGLEERERQRLERGVGAYDRRQGGV